MLVDLGGRGAYIAKMTSGPANPFNPLVLALPTWRAKRAELVATLEELDRMIAEAEAVIGGTPASLPSKPTAQTQDAPVPASTREFAGMSISDAAFAHIVEIGKPLKTREIADDLIAAGFRFTHNSPSHAVQNQLNKRAKSQDDVVFVGGGRWGLKKWYTKSELDGIVAMRGGQPGRDADLHKKKTWEAMEAAKARGVRFGRVPLAENFPQERIDKFRQLRREGCTVRAAVKAINMSPATYQKYKALMDGEPEEPKFDDGTKVVHIHRNKEKTA